jgi:hypothetical protein
MAKEVPDGDTIYIIWFIGRLRGKEPTCQVRFNSSHYQPAAADLTGLLDGQLFF